MEAAHGGRGLSQDASSPADSDRLVVSQALFLLGWLLAGSWSKILWVLSLQALQSSLTRLPAANSHSFSFKNYPVTSYLIISPRDLVLSILKAGQFYEPVKLFNQNICWFFLLPIFVGIPDVCYHTLCCLVVVVRRNFKYQHLLRA